MATLALNSGLWVRRLLIVGSPGQGPYPASEVNDGPCPENSVHLTDGQGLRLERFLAFNPRTGLREVAEDDRAA